MDPFTVLLNLVVVDASAERRATIRFMVKCILSSIHDPEDATATLSVGC